MYSLFFFLKFTLTIADPLSATIALPGSHSTSGIFLRLSSFKDLFIAYYQILYHEGKLNAKDLSLSVNHYDVKSNFDEVKGKWLDIIE